MINSPGNWSLDRDSVVLAAYLFPLDLSMCYRRLDRRMKEFTAATPA